MSPRQRRDGFVWKLKTLKRRSARFFRPSKIEVEELVDLSAQPEDRRKLWEAHVRSLISHRTKQYAGPVRLFRTRGHPIVCSFDGAFGWGAYARGGVKVAIVPGAHESALDEPHVRDLAQLIKRQLEEVRAPLTQNQSNQA